MNMAPDDRDTTDGDTDGDTDAPEGGDGLAYGAEGGEV